MVEGESEDAQTGEELPEAIDPISAAGVEAEDVEADDQAQKEVEKFAKSGVSDADIQEAQLASFKLQNDKLREELADLKSDRDFRNEYAPKIFGLICVWLVLVVGLIFLDGLSLSEGLGLPGTDQTLGFDQSDGVVLGLIGGTTASVVGLLVIVITYIFPRRNKG